MVSRLGGEEMCALESAWAPQIFMSASAPPGLEPPGCWHREEDLADGSCSAYTAGLRDGIWAAQVSMCHPVTPSMPVRRLKGRRSLSGLSSDTASTTDTALDRTIYGDVDLLAANLRGSVADSQQAFDYISGNAGPLCKTQQGSRLVQAAFEIVQGPRLQVLVDQLKGSVLETSKSPHGNHVMMKVIDIVGSDGVQFMVDEMTGKAVVMARDRFACRVIQELVEICPHGQVSGLIDELMTDGPRLVRHPFANFVMQSVIRFGTQARRLQIADFLSKDLRGYSRHRIAKNVLRLVNEIDNQTKTNIGNTLQQVQTDCLIVQPEMVPYYLHVSTLSL